MTERPSGALVALASLPLAMLAASWFLTGGFSEKPPLPPFYSKIVPLVLLVVAIITSIFAYNLARDEEPEWGAGLGARVAFKAIEGASLGYIVIAALFIALLLFVYFL